ncbi:MAG: type II toxin-antitoxin system VapB family antitoxin [Intrasporangium sp.]|uniref:type II toxin-antitoxin system VapB family antitoxin n=1 Tax=Intrasporangium sp. TaxID=1925024 RepID=UPI003F80D0FB
MALNIKDAETDRLVRQLAAETGESITVATRVAIEERLARLHARQHATGRSSDLYRIIERGRERQILDARPVDEILGYDEHGLPS